MRKHLVLIFSLVAIIILAFLLNFTNPSEAGPFGVLVFFLAFYMLMFGVAFGVVSVFGKMVGNKSNSRRKKYIYAGIIGFGPVLLLLMRSFEALNIFTVILAFLFVFLGCFLVKKRFNVVK